MDKGVFPCERSSRQMWKWRVSPKNNSLGYLQLLVSIAPDDDVLNDSQTRLRPTKADAIYRCMGKGDENRRFLRLWDCFPPGKELTTEALNKSNMADLISIAMDIDEKQEGGNDDVTSLLESRRLSLRMESVEFRNKNKNIYRLVEETHSDKSDDLCVALSSKSVGQSAHIEVGKLTVLEVCAPNNINQLWEWKKSTGELLPFASTNHDKSKLRSISHQYCLTAGWPYLTSAAFKTPNDQIVVTIINEYPSESYILLKDDVKESRMWTAVNGKSAQTITY